MRAALLILFGAITSVSHAGPPQWTWDAGMQSNNGAITIKSTNGSTSYIGTQNPTGAVAKINQSASTQPPTIVVQATSGGAPFSYVTDCYIMTLSGGSATYLGAGKTIGGAFTGVLAPTGSGRASSGFVLGALTGTAAASSGGIVTSYTWCGADSSCAATAASSSPITASYSGAEAHPVVGVAGMPTTSIQQCYP